MDNLFSLNGKVAMVIGGTKGIGLGIAKGLSKAGAKLVISSRHAEDCVEIAKMILEETGNEAVGYAVDIRELSSVEALFQSTIKKWGRIDILVNSAGINVRKDSIDFDEDDWDLVQNVQLKGVFFACQSAGRYFIKNFIKGKIINICSIDAFVVSRPNIISYMAAKGAVAQMTKALAVEWADKGICVNSIAPGYFETEMTKVLFQKPEIRNELLRQIPQKRFGDLERDIASLAIYLASEGSNYTTGQIICVDGGYTLI